MSPHHPQSNSILEIFHSFLKDCIRIYIHGKIDWEDTHSNSLVLGCFQAFILKGICSSFFLIETLWIPSGNSLCLKADTKEIRKGLPDLKAMRYALAMAMKISPLIDKSLIMSTWLPCPLTISKVVTFSM